MKLQIFDVEHGACSLLTADNGTRLMIDCGHNGTTGWKPGTYLKENNISVLEMLAVTNYDEDHASASADLFDNIDVKWLWRNKSVSSKTIKLLKSDTGMDVGIERLFYEIDNTFTGDGSSPSPSFDGLSERRGFCVSYPTFDDENNLSMAIFLKCHGIGVLFTGDLEKPALKKLLERADFRQALMETRIYIAPHHGRESGCSEDVIPLLNNVNYVVISDKGYEHETQNTLNYYYKISKGGPFRGEDKRYVLTTRNDGRIGFQFDAGSWSSY